MKLLISFILMSLLPLQANSQNSGSSPQNGWAYAWGKFDTFNSTSATKGFTMTTDVNHGALVEPVLDHNAHIPLGGGQPIVDFCLSNTIYRPSLGVNKPFSLAMTFEKGSISSGSSPFSLFSGNFGGNIFNINCSVDQDNNITSFDANFGGKNAQLTGFTVDQDMSLLIDQNQKGEITITVYSGRNNVGQLSLGLVTGTTSLDDFRIGDPNASMTLSGLGMRVMDSTDPEWINKYFDTVGVPANVPEPSTVILSLLGGSFIMLRRRRKSA